MLTVVSVTKGMGSAACGGRGCIASCLCGNGENDDIQRVLDLGPCLRMCERAARRTVLDNGSMLW